MRCLLLILSLVVLAGCGPDLDTAYGVSDAGRASVNGVLVLRQALGDGQAVRRSGMLSDRLQEENLGCLVHVATTDEPPSPEAQAWLLDWLEEESGRQVVLILRDGALGGPLCRTWADQARQEAERLGSPQDLPLMALAERFDERAVAEDRREPFRIAGKIADYGRLGFRLRADSAQPLTRPLTGWGLTTAPRHLVVSQTLEAPNLTPVVQVPLPGGARPVVLAGDLGKGRLVVVTTATGLLDGALPDPAARAFLAALVADLARYRQESSGPEETALVGRLAVRRGDEQDLDMLHLLFATPPISYVAWHLLAVLVVFLVWRNRWLGRREAPPTEDRQRFLVHVQALARHLRREDARRAVHTELTRWRGTPPPDQGSRP